jgi:hypothetical protein
MLETSWQLVLEHFRCKEVNVSPKATPAESIINLNLNKVDGADSVHGSL